METSRTARTRSRNSPSAETESRRLYALGGVVEALPELAIGLARGRMQPRSQHLRERAKDIGILDHLRSRQDDVTVFPATRVSPTQITEDQDVDVQGAIAEAGSITQTTMGCFQLFVEMQQLRQCFGGLQGHHQIEKIRAAKAHRLAFEYLGHLQLAIARLQCLQAGLQMSARITVASQSEGYQRHVSLLLSAPRTRMPRSIMMPTSSAAGTAAGLPSRRRSQGTSNSVMTMRATSSASASISRNSLAATKSLMRSATAL